MERTLIESDIDTAMSNYKGTRIGNKEYEDIISLFMSGIPENITPSKVLELVRMLISSDVKQVYVNEIRDYLFANDRELYEQYAKAFIGNSGCFEAFGVCGESRTPSDAGNKSKVFRTLKPQLHVSNSKDRRNIVKKAIRKENKSIARRRTLQEKRTAVVYKKKMDVVLEKMRKEK